MTVLPPPPNWIHSQLRNDCFAVTALPRCEVLLMNNAHWPWLILVPRGKDLQEIQDMSDALRNDVFEEVNRAGQVLRKIFDPKKINTAALGNVVPQLHIHVIARFEHDVAWPMPVWSVKDRIFYQDPVLAVQKIHAGFESI